MARCAVTTATSRYILASAHKLAHNRRGETAQLAIVTDAVTIGEHHRQVV
ncbi:MAG: hypothetical protein NZQ09_09545 [Chloroflexus sp.]|nr:hypothetical protein [Chloroflexus sp.]